MVQLVPLFAISQRFSPVIPPGSFAGDHPTTAFVAKAVLFALLESVAFTIFPENVSDCPLAASVGVTGIRTVSEPIGADILVVFVHVTPVQVCAVHDQPLSVNGAAGPFTFAGIINHTVCSQDELRLPAFDITTGIWDKRLVVSGPSGEPIPGMRSGTFAATYGRSLHSTVPE